MLTAKKGRTGPVRLSSEGITGSNPHHNKEKTDRLSNRAITDHPNNPAITDHRNNPGTGLNRPERNNFS